MMATRSVETVFFAPKLRSRDSQVTLSAIDLSSFSTDMLSEWGAKNTGNLHYRIELSRRISQAFGDADQLIMFDDAAVGISLSEQPFFTCLRGCEMPFLCTLWLSLGFRHGGQVLVYAPPNPVEMRIFLMLKQLVEQYLQRMISIRILYEDTSHSLVELVSLFEHDPDKYTALCELFALRSAKEFYPEYHVQMLKQHLETITKGSRLSFVYPFKMTKFHKQELGSYSDRLILPDVPTNDKAQHNLFLRSKGFTALPQLLAVFPDGSVTDKYEQYVEKLKDFDTACTASTAQNIEVGKS